ncbi:MAG: hypothetical protein IKS78_01765, partial [Clostridia bacterium]|nr:hypothetical protein [Clostridia bacterium]
MAGFPGAIEYAAESGAAYTPPAPPSPEKAAPSPGKGGPRRQERDLVWYSAPDGSLYTDLNGKSYRAIPMAAWGLPLERAVERRTINGVEYAVFALDAGQIV